MHAACRWVPNTRAERGSREHFKTFRSGGPTAWGGSHDCWRTSFRKEAFPMVAHTGLVQRISSNWSPADADNTSA